MTTRGGVVVTQPDSPCWRVPSDRHVRHQDGVTVFSADDKVGGGASRCDGPSVIVRLVSDHKGLHRWSHQAAATGRFSLTACMASSMVSNCTSKTCASGTGMSRGFILRRWAATRRAMWYASSSVNRRQVRDVLVSAYGMTGREVHCCTAVPASTQNDRPFISFLHTDGMATVDRDKLIQITPRSMQIAIVIVCTHIFAAVCGGVAVVLVRCMRRREKCWNLECSLEGLRWCDRCHTARYCSEECGANHWHALHHLEVIGLADETTACTLRPLDTTSPFLQCAALRRFSRADRREFADSVHAYYFADESSFWKSFLDVWGVMYGFVRFFLGLRVREVHRLLTRVLKESMRVRCKRDADRQAAQRCKEDEAAVTRNEVIRRLTRRLERCLDLETWR